MQPNPTPSPYKATLYYIVAILIFFSIVQQSCKKTDFSSYRLEPDKSEQFFSVRNPVNNKVAHVMEILKAQNARRNFVRKLPGYSGLPVWDKLKFPARSSFLSRDTVTDEFFFLPLTISDTSLSMIMIGRKINDSTYDIKWYSAPDLNESSKAGSRTSASGENLLLLFMYMEGSTFERKDFYHIPDHLITSEKGDSLTDSTKILHVKNSNIIVTEDPQTGSLVATMCFYIFSGNCTCNNGGVCLDWWRPCPTGVCTTQICFDVPIDSPCPLCSGGGGTGEDPPPGQGDPPGEGGGGGDSCTTCPPTNQCRAPFYIEDPCPGPGNPMPPVTDTLTLAEILQLLHEENVAIKKQRDSVWDSAYSADEEYHFFIKKYSGVSKVIGIATDHDPDGVTPNRVVEANSNPDGDYHTHQDHPSPGYRHPHDPQDVFVGNVRHPKLYYRSYVDCGDTLYVIVNENTSKIKAYLRTVHILEYQAAYSQALQSAGINRRSIGLARLLLLLGNSSVSGMGLYKSINADKTVFIKVN